MSFRKISHTTIIILFASFIFFVAKADIFDDIALALKTGNSKELAKYFRPRVELKVGSNEDIYSKAQAEMILKDFFEKNPPTDFSVKHRGASAKGLPYLIGYLYTPAAKYRTYILFKEEGDKLYIQEIKFDKE
jgi:hypothetical protein